MSVNSYARKQSNILKFAEAETIPYVKPPSPTEPIPDPPYVVERKKIKQEFEEERIVDHIKDTFLYSGKDINQDRKVYFESGGLRCFYTYNTLTHFVHLVCIPEKDFWTRLNEKTFEFQIPKIILPLQTAFAFIQTTTHIYPIQVKLYKRGEINFKTTWKMTDIEYREGIFGTSFPFIEFYYIANADQAPSNV